MLARSSGVVNDRSSALEREVERGQHGPLQLDVDDSLGVLDRPLGSAAMRCAQAIACSSTSSSGHTWLTRPIAAARCAGMRSPVSAYSLASWRLVSSGHTTGPPSAATSPSSTWGSARCALSAM